MDLKIDDRWFFVYSFVNVGSLVRSFFLRSVGHIQGVTKVSQFESSQVKSSQDVTFEIGRLFMAIKLYDIASWFFNRSIIECGDHHVTQYNLGLCHQYVGNDRVALTHFDKSILLSNGEYHEAREWKQRIMLRIHQQQQVLKQQTQQQQTQHDQFQAAK
jgi:hypothetical protein